MTEAPRYRFTMRQQQVIRGVAEGLTYGEIAARCEIGYETVVTYAKQVAAQLDTPHLPPKSAIRHFLHRTSPKTG